MLPKFEEVSALIMFLAYYLLIKTNPARENKCHSILFSKQGAMDAVLSSAGVEFAGSLLEAMYSDTALTIAYFKKIPKHVHSIKR